MRVDIYTAHGGTSYIENQNGCNLPVRISLGTIQRRRPSETLKMGNRAISNSASHSNCSLVGVSLKPSTFSANRLVGSELTLGQRLSILFIELGEGLLP